MVNRARAGLLPQLPTRLTRVHMREDARVAAFLDGGCNRTCHTPAFIERRAEGGRKEHANADGRTPRLQKKFWMCSQWTTQNFPHVKRVERRKNRIMWLNIKVHSTLRRVKDARAGLIMDSTFRCARAVICGASAF